MSEHEWLKELRELAEDGEKLQRKAEAAQAEIAALFAGVDTGAVTAVFDSAGLLIGLDFDSDLRSPLTAAEFQQEINMAILRARSFSMTASTGVTPQDDTLSPAGLLASMAGGSVPEPKEFTDDFGYVTATAMWGNLLGVTCDPGWLASTPDHVVTHEIVRMAQLAARETDSMGRFSTKSESEATDE